MGLATALKERGHEVILLSPRDEFTHLLVEAGFRWVQFPLRPRGKNVFLEPVSILFLIYFYLREKPDIVNHFTPKGVIYGSIAAKLAGVHSIFNTITGLGSVFADQSNRKLKWLVLALYQITLMNTTVLFQNMDDQKYFLEKKIGDPGRFFVIPGSGVDMNRFKVVPETNEKAVVLLSSRFVEEKGIRYFVEASRTLISRKVDARFVLVGRPEDDQPTSIHHTEITQWVNEGLIEWWGWHNTMEKIYPLAHIVCLPTYYMEGIPKSLIEAAACGRPLVATDVPGCREIVHYKENGFLVPTHNALALADAIEKLVMNAELRNQMGRKSREIAVAGFSMEKIVASYLAIYEKARLD